MTKAKIKTVRISKSNAVDVYAVMADHVPVAVIYADENGTTKMNASPSEELIEFLKQMVNAPKSW